LGADEPVLSLDIDANDDNVRKYFLSFRSLTSLHSERVATSGLFEERLLHASTCHQRKANTHYLAENVFFAGSQLEFLKNFKSATKTDAKP